jgi:AraC-like DNA-binding protein
MLVGYRVHYPGLKGASHYSLGSLAFGSTLFFELCGVEPSRVLLSLPTPQDLAPFKRAFGRAKIIFEAEHFGLVYSQQTLAKPIPTADPAMHAQMRCFVAERWTYLEPDIRDRIMRVLVPLVLAGIPSVKMTARLLDMHPRTLNRALRARAYSHRQAVNDARFEMASQLLRDTGVGVGNLAKIFGYSEVSAFSRFFATMAGLPPSEWKQAALSVKDSPA